MTEYDDLPFDPPVEEGWPPAVVVEREPRPCKRHDWMQTVLDANGLPINPAKVGPLPHVVGYCCRRCGKPKDGARARRGKTSRNRGNAFEREVAAKLGGRRVGQYGDQVDVDVTGWLRVQCKNGAGYPERIDRWLRAIPVQAGLLRAVVTGDAPGPGGKRRILITLDLAEFVDWYGGRSR